MPKVTGHVLRVKRHMSWVLEVSGHVPWVMGVSICVSVTGVATYQLPTSHKSFRCLYVYVSTKSPGRSCTYILMSSQRPVPDMLC